ncbi:hypothetical protein ACCS53_39155, partial [Rhizobium ruizarguesonis]
GQLLRWLADRPHIDGAALEATIIDWFGIDKTGEGSRNVVAIWASLCPMPVSEPLMPLLLPRLSLVVTLSCHVLIPLVV